MLQIRILNVRPGSEFGKKPGTATLAPFPPNIKLTRMGVWRKGKFFSPPPNIWVSLCHEYELKVFVCALLRLHLKCKIICIFNKHPFNPVLRIRFCSDPDPGLTFWIQIWSKVLFKEYFIHKNKPFSKWCNLFGFGNLWAGFHRLRHIFFFFPF